MNLWLVRNTYFTRKMATANTFTQRRLLAHHDVQIYCHGDDGTSFVKLFRDTWKILPLAVRRKTLRFWRQSSFPIVIELSNMWAPAEAFGQVGVAGSQLRFRQEAFACFPPQAAEWVIAHELAHVYQKACSRWPGGENEQENETHANQLAEEWGFDRNCLALLIYFQQQGLSIADACKHYRKRVPLQ